MYSTCEGQVNTSITLLFHPLQLAPAIAIPQQPIMGNSCHMDFSLVLMCPLGSKNLCYNVSHCTPNVPHVPSTLPYLVRVTLPQQIGAQPHNAVRGVWQICFPQQHFATKSFVYLKEALRLRLLIHLPNIFSISILRMKNAANFLLRLSYRQTSKQAIPQ